MNTYAWISIFLALALIGTSTYGYLEIQALHEENNKLTGALVTTNENIGSLAQSTQKALNELGQDLSVTQAVFNQSIANVQTSVVSLSEASQQQFQQFDTQLLEVKQESEEKLEELEEQINLNLKTGDFTSVVEDVIPSIVSIQTDKSLGSGVFVENDGILLTNYHVIDGATAAVVITHDGDTHDVSILGYDSGLDLAVLKIDNDYPHLPFANSHKIQVGQRVIALGNPGGLQFTVTEGIISATNRQSGGNTYLQTDVPINPGNSGGPLVDAKGRVVGINTLKAKNLEGVGFAIPSNIADEILEEVLSS